MPSAASSRRAEPRPPAGQWLLPGASAPSTATTAWGGAGASPAAGSCCRGRGAEPRQPWGRDHLPRDSWLRALPPAVKMAAAPLADVSQERASV